VIVKQKLLWRCSARANERGLTYSGSAFLALSADERRELSTRLEVRKLERCPIPGLRFPDAHWMRPQLTARVRHLSGTSYLRHATVRTVE